MWLWRVECTVHSATYVSDILLQYSMIYAKVDDNKLQVGPASFIKFTCNFSISWGCMEREGESEWKREKENVREVELWLALKSCKKCVDYTLPTNVGDVPHHPYLGHKSDNLRALKTQRKRERESNDKRRKEGRKLKPSWHATSKFVQLWRPQRRRRLVERIWSCLRFWPKCLNN